MADYGVSIVWGDTKTGREKKALELWLDSVTLNEKAVADSRIESWDAVGFEPAPNAPVGVMRIFGTQEQVEEFINADDFQEKIMRAGLLLNGVGYRRFMTGDRLADGFARFSQAIESL